MGTPEQRGEKITNTFKLILYAVFNTILRQQQLHQQTSVKWAAECCTTNYLYTVNCVHDIIQR